MMSTNNEPDDNMMMCCASCGVAEVDDIKLNKCPACDLVRYCSDKCKQEHRPKHEQACKERAAELRDEILFRQPESSHFGDCPICAIPLPIDPAHSSMYPCCCKMICNGCVHAYRTREREENLQHKCPFCRQPTPDTPAEVDIGVMKRVKVNDPGALCFMGNRRYHEGDYDVAFEYFTKAAELGYSQAHYHLSTMYMKGIGVEEDKKKTLHHLTEATIGGHPDARYNLAYYDLEYGRFERVARHLIIAANLGHDGALQKLKRGYRDGHVSKEDFAAALRAHQSAVNATKSPQREEAEAFLQKKV